MDDLFSDALRQLLRDQCTTKLVREIEGGQLPAPLWQRLEESGFPDAMVSEEDGGADMSLSEVFALFELCGSYALPVPLAETMLARAVLAQAGVPRPAGSISFGQANISPDGAVVSNLVPCGRVADWVLVTQGEQCLLMPVARARKSPAVFALDATLEWPGSACAGAQEVAGGHDLKTLQACVYAAQLAGALTSVFNRTLQYANERSQFGRPIGKFQAIQHQLSVISEHTFAARMAARIGCESKGKMPQRVHVAVAKARSSEAGLEVAALAHSIHGAIGFTEEFDLQLFTRRLHLWRQAGGSESYWYDVLGTELVERQSEISLDLIRMTTDIH